MSKMNLSGSRKKDAGVNNEVVVRMFGTISFTGEEPPTDETLYRAIFYFFNEDWLLDHFQESLGDIIHNVVSVSARFEEDTSNVQVKGLKSEEQSDSKMKKNVGNAGLVLLVTSIVFVLAGIYVYSVNKKQDKEDDVSESTDLKVSRELNLTLDSDNVSDLSFNAATII